MPTSGTVIRSIEKLKGKENYIPWSKSVRYHLQKSSAWRIVQGLFVKPEQEPRYYPNPPINVRALRLLEPENEKTDEELKDELEIIKEDIKMYEKWMTDDADAKEFIQATITKQVEAAMGDLDDSKTMWDVLKKKYGDAGCQEHIHELDTFFKLRLQDCKNITEYCKTLEGCVHRLQTNYNLEVPNHFYGYRLVTGLGPEFQNTVETFHSAKTWAKPEEIIKALKPMSPLRKRPELPHQKPTAGPRSKGRNDDNPEEKP